MSKKRKTGIKLLSIASAFLVGYILLTVNLSNLHFWGRFLRGHLFFYMLILFVIGLVLTIKGKRVIYKETAYFANNICSGLKDSPTILSDENIKKIHRLLPVPTDYKILWAEILSFGNHPSGIVITNQALILKAPKNSVKKLNDEVKEYNKKVGKKDKKGKIKFIYRIIPGDYYSPQ